MSVTRCDTCTGRKTVIGLGCMIKECPTCYGVGFVTVKDEPVVPKRTRKPRSAEKCQSNDTSPSDDLPSIPQN